MPGVAPAYHPCTIGEVGAAAQGCQSVTYAWRDSGAPAQFLVLLIIGVLVVWFWFSTVHSTKEA